MSRRRKSDRYSVRAWHRRDGRKIYRKCSQDRDLTLVLTVFRGLATPPSAACLIRWIGWPKRSIVPDRLRKVPSFATLAKPLFQLDLIKMTVSLTVSDTVARQNARRDNDLADQLMTEWNDSAARAVTRDRTAFFEVTWSVRWAKKQPVCSRYSGLARSASTQKVL